jgi:hypothetical protein
MKRLWTLLSLLCASASSCTPNFQNASDILDLRILAAQAEPAEAQYDENGADDVQVRVLAPDPRSAPATLRWQICQPTDSLRCDGFQVFLSGQVSRQSGDEFPPVTVSIPLFVVQAVVASDKLGGLGGIRAQFSFSVEDGDPAGPAYGEKVLLYSKRGTAPNHNPNMTGVQLSKNGVPARVPVFAPGQEMCLSAGVQYGVRPVLAPDARETYTATDLQNNTVTLTEDPSYAFFTTPGATMDRDGATEPVDGKAPPDGLARIQANNGHGTFYIVIRDGRGGQSWISFPWLIPFGATPCGPADDLGHPARP